MKDRSSTKSISKFASFIESSESLSKSDSTVSEQSTDNPKHLRTTTAEHKPMNKWAALGVCSRLADHITSERMGLMRPTAMQCEAIPVLLSPRKDLWLQSETGSGKTLAFLVPIVHHLVSGCGRLTRMRGTQCLIVEPTRELALQTLAVAQILCQRKFPFVVCGVLMGGQSRHSEKAALRKGVHIAIGTPGRIADHLGASSKWRYDAIKYLVFDECDRLLDLGFGEQMQAINEAVCRVDPRNKKHSTVMCSATLSKGIDEFSKIALKKGARNTVKIGVDNNMSTQQITIESGKSQMASEIGTEEDTKEEAATGMSSKSSVQMPSSLQLQYLCVRREWKVIALMSVLRQFSEAKKDRGGVKGIVFVDTCAIVNYLFKLFPEAELFKHSEEKVLSAATVSTATRAAKLRAIPSVHCSADGRWFELRGDMGQRERTATYFAFCNATNGVLFTTDVCARGLDIPQTDFCVQFSVPQKVEEFVHRSGRTARMGRSGRSLLLLTPPEMGFLEYLKKNKIRIDDDECRVGASEVYSFLNRTWRTLHRDARMATTSLLSKSIGVSEASFVSGREAVQATVKHLVYRSEELRELAAKASSSFVSAYGTYPRELKHIFHVRNLDFNLVCDCFFLTRDRHKGMLKRGGQKDEVRSARRKKKDKSAMRKGIAETNAIFAAAPPKKKRGTLSSTYNEFAPF